MAVCWLHLTPDCPCITVDPANAATITVTNDGLAEQLIRQGQQLIDLGMQLRDHGFEVHH